MSAIAGSNEASRYPLIFAYGSNMLTRRIQDRVASAVPLCVGYVSRYRFAFNKRGRDGSAKANAAFTGVPTDRVWGIVFALPETDQPRLDEFEPGYDRIAIDVFGKSDTVNAQMYIARQETIDRTLKPFCWYQRLVVSGAIEHRLPADYIRSIEDIVPTRDQDEARHALHYQLAKP